MPASGWRPNWKAAPAAEQCPSGLVRAAARGDSLEHLLDLGARAMLTTFAADRVGIWLAGGRSGQAVRGTVVESTPGPIPGEWKRLDISTPFLRTALEGPDPLHVESGSEPTKLQFGPLVEMHSATWIPIRARNSTLGLAMVAHERPGAQLDQVLLRAHADEIALSIVLDRDTCRSNLAAEELRSQLRLSRAILAGAPADSVFSQIAHAARHYIQAEFIALGRPSESPVLGDGWDGPERWRTLLHQQPLLRAWRKVLEEGQDLEISGEALTEGMGFPSGPPLDRVIALPIVVRSRICGVLMAGLLPSEDSTEDLVRLESYAVLAATALDLEAARSERAASTRSLQQIIEGSQECLVIVDDKGIVREASQAANRFLFPNSRRTDELHLEDFFSGVAREAVIRWRERFARPGCEPALTAHTRMVPLEAALDGGTVVCMRLRSAVEGMGAETRSWLIEFEDRSSRQTSLETGVRLEAELTGLIDSIDSGVLLLDAAGNIRVVSDRLAAILGTERRRLFELGTMEALIESVACRFSRPAESAARWREQVRRGDEACWDEFELIRPTRKVVERFARPLSGADGGHLGWLEVFRDITGQRSIQSKFLQSEKMAALGQLVSGIVHELNNPLTSIQGYAQLLLSRRSTSQRAADARRISQEAERASRIVKNLLLFSREAKPERRAVNLNEVIERTLALRAYDLKLQNIHVDMALDANLPRALADAAQLQQVILNLIVNAEQAITQANTRQEGEGSGHGRIVIRTRRLAGNRVGVEVSDNGPGIPPEVVSRIFDPFFTTKPAGSGTGLGLSIVYGIVQEHDGEVSVESQPGHGATLTFELPALSEAAFEFTAIGAASASHVAAVVHAPSAVRKIARPEFILVVEDEPTVAQLIADVLAEEGHRVDVLLDSREALGRLEEKNYDLVICDLKMPFLDGAGLYRTLVRTGSRFQHRLLFVTGDTMSPRTLEFLRSSGVPYLAKPFFVEELKEAVHRAVDAAAAGDETLPGPDRLRVVAREK
jgi:signal transduction histidine kinase/CheY-like chemotaxis protein